MTWGRRPHVRWDELAVCRRNGVRLRLDRGKFAAANELHRQPGGWTVHFSVSLASAAFFGASRSVRDCPARIIARGLRTVPGDLAKGGSDDRSPSGGREELPTFVRCGGLGRRSGRVQRGWDDHLVEGRCPESSRTGSPRVRFFDLPPEIGHDAPITTTDSSAVGQGVSDAVNRDGRPRRHLRVAGKLEPSSSSPVGLRARWIRFREVDSPGWERCRGQKPREDVRNPSGQGRPGGERTGDGMSILEGDCKATRGTNQARNGPGKLRAGTRQGPYSKGVGGAARPRQRLPLADIL